MDILWLFFDLVNDMLRTLTLILSKTNILVFYNIVAKGGKRNVEIIKRLKR